MKFTLKDYQADAVREALDRLRKARRRWHEDTDKQAFSLTAVTGAGKTVVAAAVLEALFHGDDEYDFDADPGAVIIWFSDDPSLNEQTRFRLMEASDRLQHTDMVVVENTFHERKFRPKRIYFLNTQKLGKNSLLVRGAEEDGGSGARRLTPDRRTYTIWDTIRNTVEDGDLTLYLVLDEAHRGMGSVSRAAQTDRDTIVKRLINGANGTPGISVVWGISATVERFNVAMQGAQGRSILPGVVVDPTRVQESGLIKDTIVLDIPDEAAGRFQTVLVRRATDQLKEATEAWAEYARQQGEPEPVIPLMVLQVPNRPDPSDIGNALDTIFRQWPELPRDCVANVFGEHATETYGDYSVPYVTPERVQEDTWIRVLLAKDAISSGWDCPRAEVMVSFRAAQDRTHITQLLGRMVRSPLARRIPGNERLNSVHCLLPLFDTKTVHSVADALMKGGDDVAVPPTGRVLINPTEMTPNPTVTDAVWEKFESLPSQTRPQRCAKPAKRLTALAHALAVDGLLRDAGQKAHAEMHKVLDAAGVRFKDEIAVARDNVMTVEGQTLVANLRGQSKTFNQFWEDADMAVINDAYNRAKRVLSPDIARTYAEHIVRFEPDMDDAEMDEAYMEARVEIAALGLVADVQPYFDSEADKLAKAWLEKYRVAIKNLSHDRQDSYKEIQAMSREPQDIALVRPESRFEPTAARENDVVTPLPTYKHHLLCDEQGDYPAEFASQWEIRVLQAESQRGGFSFWYRNPQYPGQASLGVAYVEDDEYRIVRPDFVFFATQQDGTVVADIVDPHGIHLSDALPKLQGLAKYAETHRQVYRRVESVAEINSALRVLDLTREPVRRAIASATSISGLYSGEWATDYV